MARRRRRDADLIGPVMQLIALIFLACVVFAPVRQALATLGIVLVSILVAVGIGLAIDRSTGPKSRSADFSLNSPAPPSTPTIPETPRPAARPANLPNPTTAEIIEQLRSIDWFQFEKIVELT